MTGRMGPVTFRCGSHYAVGVDGDVLGDLAGGEVEIRRGPYVGDNGSAIRGSRPCGRGRRPRTPAVAVTASAIPTFFCRKRLALDALRRAVCWRCCCMTLLG